jgi:sporulation protein YlmC with PRC-barrel domain
LFGSIVTAIKPDLAVQKVGPAMPDKELGRCIRVECRGVMCMGQRAMRTGLAIIAVVAVGLIAAVGAYSDASGRAEQAARWAQTRQVAQTPEPSPQPMGQSEPENPPSTAAPPATAPPPNPPPGTPAVVLDDQEVSTILGKSVRSNAGEDMGRIVDIIVSRDGQVRAAIIDFGGFLGIGTRKIAVDWRALNFAPVGKPGSITVDLTRNQVRLAPEYKRGEPVVVVSSVSPGQVAPSSEAAVPER